MADLIQKGRNIAVRCYAHEPDKIVIPHRLSDFERIQRNNGRIALALEGYLGILDCHYGPHKWVTSFGRLDWRVPQLFLFKPIPDALNAFSDGGKSGAAAVVCQPPQQSQQPDAHIREYFGPCGGSAQFKELFAVVMALTNVPEPINLFSDSLYVVNLLPGLLNSHIRLDNNPITPLMIQAHTLLLEQVKPIYVHHLRGHQNLPGLLSMGNSWPIDRPPLQSKLITYKMLMISTILLI